jgi:hypothetical protein
MKIPRKVRRSSYEDTGFRLGLLVMAWRDQDDQESRDTQRHSLIDRLVGACMGSLDYQSDKKSIFA